MKFNRYNNTIKSPEKVHFGDIGEIAAALHAAICTMCYKEIILNFCICKLAEPEFMLAVCSLCSKYTKDGVEINLTLPSDDKLKRLFINTNWAHYISPHKYDFRKFNGYSHVPATHFSNPAEQYDAVSKIINVILSHIDGIQRSDFSAFEWAVNEMTDNVLVHSDSHSGFVQVSHLRKRKKKISFIVCDIGIGIPNSLRNGTGKDFSDEKSLAEAIKEGVTRDKTIGQGNGLFGSHRVSVNSGGIFKIRSGNALLLATAQGISTSTEKVPFNGTVIAAEIDFSSPGLLESALHFSDGIHQTWSRIEEIYEDEDQDVLKISIRESSESFGSRKAGTPTRQKIKNLMEMHPKHQVIIDFSGIDLLTSSFADELLGKLLIEIGIDQFKNRVSLKNLSNINYAIINRSINQRIQLTTDPSYPLT